jgi:hypothetical protein
VSGTLYFSRTIKDSEFFFTKAKYGWLHAHSCIAWASVFRASFLST